MRTDAIFRPGGTVEILLHYFPSLT